MPTRQTYTVLIPFPTHAGHWSVVGEELDLLDVEATALRTAGRQRHPGRKGHHREG